MLHSEPIIYNDPVQMIDSLEKTIALDQARLFAIGCCRRIWELLDKDCKSAIEIAERRLGSLATIEELRNSVNSIIKKYGNENSRSAAQAVHAALYDPLIADCYAASSPLFAESNLTPYAQDAMRPSFAFAKYASIHSAYAKAADLPSKMDAVSKEYEGQCKLLQTILG